MSHANRCRRLAIFAVLGTVLVAPSMAQETSPPKSQSNAAMQEMMKRMMPGEGHKLFPSMTGKWMGKLKVWNSAVPTAPPEESPTEGEFKLILGGRFVLEESKSSIKSMPMQRMSILGYNNVTKLYTLIFYSSMETATNIATGSASADGKTLTLRGVFDDPQGKHPFKNVIRFESDDVHVFESYAVLPDGKELKLVEETTSRVK